MFRLAVFALVALSLNGQPAQFARAAKNPYDLAKYLGQQGSFPWPLVWQALRVSEPPSSPLCEPCSIDVITVQPSQAILAIESWPVDIYLRFQENQSMWQYTGAYTAFRKNYPSRYEVSRVGGKPFLRVSIQGANGSNWDSEMEEWFDLSQKTFEPVFGFTVQGTENRMGFGVSRSVQAIAISDGSADEIKLRVRIRFSAYHETDLGSVDYDATYARESSSEDFTLRAVQPTLEHGLKITASQFEALANIVTDDGITAEQLMSYVMPRLREIASGTDTDAKGWLESILSFSKDTPEKRELEAILKAKSQ
jgi:hypothetical protein